MKHCSKCQTEKPVAEFYKSVNGYHTYCIVCFKVYQKQARIKRGMREPATEGTRKCSRCREVKHVTEFSISRSTTLGRNWYCKPCTVIQNMEKRRENPGKNQAYMRAYLLAKNYGMTVADYDALLASQGGVCAICGGPPRMAGGRDVFHVDHCHTTGKVRGILCGRCNLTIGQFDDDPALLRIAAEYLERSVSSVA